MAGGERFSLFSSVMLVGALLILSQNISSAEGNQEMKHQYGKQIRFLDKVGILLPDFSIVFQGERKVDNTGFPPGFLYYDFKVWKGKKIQLVSWSSGTGEIAPIVFEFEGKKYVLEMGISSLVKHLEKGELIIWKENEFRIKEKEFYDHLNK